VSDLNRKGSYQSMSDLLQFNEKIHILKLPDRKRNEHENWKENFKKV
jgi:hypothetical protein